MDHLSDLNNPHFFSESTSKEFGKRTFGYKFHAQRKPRPRTSMVKTSPVYLRHCYKKNTKATGEAITPRYKCPSRRGSSRFPESSISHPERNGTRLPDHDRLRAWRQAAQIESLSFSDTPPFMINLMSPVLRAPW